LISSSYWSSLMVWEATDQVWCYEKLLIKFDAMRNYWSSLMLWEATDQVWCYEKLLFRFDAMRSYWSSLHNKIQRFSALPLLKKRFRKLFISWNLFSWYNEHTFCQTIINLNETKTWSVTSILQNYSRRLGFFLSQYMHNFQHFFVMSSEK
jgi:hypothetical protein